MRRRIKTTNQVPGFELSVPEERQTQPQGHVLLVCATGSHPRYAGEGELEIVLLYMDIDEGNVSRWEDDDKYYLAVPASDLIQRAELVEKFDDPDPSLRGITLVIWSFAFGNSLPFYELVIAPFQIQDTPLN